MSECKNCIHYNVCDCDIGFGWANCPEFASINADEVVVVRYKDCQYGRSIDNTKSPEKYFKDDCVVCECEDVVGDEPMIYPPSHFCSYGKMDGGSRNGT